MGEKSRGELPGRKIPIPIYTFWEKVQGELPGRKSPMRLCFLGEGSGISPKFFSELLTGIFCVETEIKDLEFF